MAAITINIPEEQLQQLQVMAQANGISPEELLRATIEDWLNYPKGDFEQAANYVIKKNSELYCRLARISHKSWLKLLKPNPHWTFG